MKLVEEALKVDDRCGFAYETLGTIEVQRLVLQTVEFVQFVQ